MPAGSDLPAKRRPRLITKLLHKVDDAKRRRRPTGFQFALADRLEFLHATDWDRVSQNSSLFAQRDYLQMLEQCAPDGIHSRYALIYLDGVAVAAVSAQIVDVNGSQLVQPKERLEWKDRLALRALKITALALQAIHRRVLVCGNLLAWGQHGVAIAAGQEPADVWPAIAEALYRIRRADKLHGQTDYVLIKDVSGSLHDSAKALRPFSYRQFETEPNMVLTLAPKWSCFTDYLDSLNKKYRKIARGVLEEIEQGGCRIERLTHLDDVSDDIHALYLQVAGRANVRLARLQPEYLPQLARVLGPDRFRCSIIRRNDRIVGFVTTVKDGDTAVGYFLGVDYAVNDDLPIYFRLLYAVIEDSLDLGCREVSLGRTALEAKARLGARPVPFHVWIRHRVPILNLMVRQLLKVVPHAEAPERNPFKG